MAGVLQTVLEVSGQAPPLLYLILPTVNAIRMHSLLSTTLFFCINTTVSATSPSPLPLVSTGGIFHAFA